MTTAARPASSRRGRRDKFEYLVGSFVLLAVVASVIAVVFRENTQWLLLGLVASLWGVVLASIAMTRSRREAATAQARAADLKTVYDLELEREVTARRMHEYQVERTVREEVRAESSLEMAELRDELRALRENLAVLLGGDLLVERVALRAESTRLRSLSDTARLAAGGRCKLEHRPEVDFEDAVVEDEPPPPVGSTERTDVIPKIADEPPAQPLVAERDPEPDPARQRAPEAAVVPEPEPAVADAPEPEPAPEPVDVPEPVAPAVEPDLEPVPDPEPVVETQPDQAPAPVEPEAPAPEPVDVPAPIEPDAPAPEPVDVPAPIEPDAPAPIEPEAPSPAGGGRRRRPEPAPFDAAPELAPVEDTPAQEEDEEGAHSAGRSVSDLIAAYGAQAGAAPRRRRRAD